jgi:predicted secreted Zn-dependent protease
MAVAACSGTSALPAGTTPPPPTRVAAVTPSPSPEPLRAALGEELLVRGIAYVTVTAARELPAHQPGVAGHRVVFVFVELRTGSRPLLLTEDSFALVDGTMRPYRAVSGGVNPALAVPGSLDANAVASGYLTFEVPFGGQYQLRFTTSDHRVALFAIGEVVPAPTPRPTPKPRRQPTPAPTARLTPRPESLPAIPEINGSFFGPDVRVTTYTVSGATPIEIDKSMRKNGPYSDWLEGPATGLTKTETSQHIAFARDANGSCTVRSTGNPAVDLSWTIVMPRWSPPSGVSRQTVVWWVEQQAEIAVHERTHVNLYREAEKQLNAAAGSSTCANLEDRMLAVWADARRRNCEFDMKEYGYAVGLTLESCLAHD